MATNQPGQQQTSGQGTQKNVPQQGTTGQTGQAGNIQVRREGERGGGLGRRESWFPGQLSGSPFGLMRRMMEDMDRMFEDFGMGRSLLGGNLLPQLGRRLQEGGQLWMPQVDVFERDGQFIVRADLPGMNKDDIKVDITDDQIVLQGERKYEHEQNEKGLYHSERSYGSFYRAIPLPEGISGEDAKANFKNGVLEISLKAPEEKQKSRRLNIEEGAGTAPASATKH